MLCDLLGFQHLNVYHFLSYQTSHLSPAGWEVKHADRRAVVPDWRQWFWRMRQRLHLSHKVESYFLWRLRGRRHMLDLAPRIFLTCRYIIQSTSIVCRRGRCASAGWQRATLLFHTSALRVGYHFVELLLFSWRLIQIERKKRDDYGTTT